MDQSLPPQYAKTMWYFCGAKQTLRFADDGPIQIGMATASEAPDARRSLAHSTAAASDFRQKPPPLTWISLGQRNTPPRSGADAHWALL